MAASFSPATAAPKATAGSVQQVAFAPTGIFQSLEFETNATAGIDGWRSFFKRLAKEEASLEACTSDAVACPPTLRAWRGRLESWRTLTPRAKLIQVNRWANAVIHYGSDAAIYKLADHWATPGQSLLGRGDCEDYALLKYATLRALGFDENNLRIVVVNDLTKGIGHAVLSARTDEGTFILDNQDSRVLRHDTVSRYAPVYSINATGR